MVTTALLCGAWGSFGDISYKIKPIDGALWGDEFGHGSLIKGRGADREIMFSFDDGPDHRSTPLLLDHLDRYGLKTVFFINGHRMHSSRPDAPENVEVLRDIYRRGHIIGNHTFSHRNLAELSAERIQWQVDATSRLVEKITGHRTWLFRPPFGKLGKAGNFLARSGYTTVMWSIDPLDWQTDDPTEVFRRVVKALEDNPEGGIIDLHDTNLASVEAFPLIMEWIEQRNVELASMGEPVYKMVGIESFYQHRRRSKR